MVPGFFFTRDPTPTQFHAAFLADFVRLLRYLGTPPGRGNNEMPHATIAALAIALVTASLQASPQKTKVDVCIRPVDDSPVLERAQIVASLIYAKVGIQIDWRKGRACPPGAIDIELTENRPPTFLPGALAHAMIYEGTHVEVFLDRMYRVALGQKHTLLGHVFAHEISHMLQRTEEHADQGLMKSHWTYADYTSMQIAPLTFTAGTIARIHAGAVQRSTKHSNARGTANDRRDESTNH
jgi:hypothetical protein